MLQKACRGSIPRTFNNARLHVVISFPKQWQAQDFRLTQTSSRVLWAIFMWVLEVDLRFSCRFWREIQDLHVGFEGRPKSDGVTASIAMYAGTVPLSQRIIWFLELETNFTFLTKHIHDYTLFLNKNKIKLPLFFLLCVYPILGGWDLRESTNVGRGSPQYHKESDILRDQSLEWDVGLPANQVTPCCQASITLVFTFLGFRTSSSNASTPIL